jgi:transposase-like protein
MQTALATRGADTRRSICRPNSELIHSPPVTTLDGYAASHPTVPEVRTNGLLPANTKVRSSKRLNYLIGQDHRNIKSRANVMPSFKRVGNAATAISRIELARIALVKVSSISPLSR